MPKNAPDKIRVTITESPAHEELPRTEPREVPVTTASRRPVAALSPSSQTAPVPGGLLVRRLAVAGAASAVLIASASLLVLRPRASAPPPAPPKPAMDYKSQATLPARITYAVRVGPYRTPTAVQHAHQRLRNLGFEPILLYSADGIHLRALTTPDEPRATQVARGLQQDGFTAIVTETGPDSGLLKAVDAAEPRYRVSGVRVDFEAGQSKGWEISGSAISMRNSSLFSLSGEHSLEVALRETSHAAPGILRLRPESVVLPQDRFVAHALQPTSAGGRLGAAFYVIDARGQTLRNTMIPLNAEKWVQLQLVVSPHVTLPIQEIGIEFRTSREPWTGAVYVDRVEQQRPR
jgi:hypothetical protein